MSTLVSTRVSPQAYARLMENLAATVRTHGVEAATAMLRSPDLLESHGLQGAPLVEDRRALLWRALLSILPGSRWKSRAEIARHLADVSIGLECDPKLVQDGVRALTGTEFARVLPEELGRSIARRADGPFCVNGEDLWSLAHSAEPRPGPFAHIRGLRKACAKGLIDKVRAHALEPRREQTDYVGLRRQAEALLGFELPANAIIQDEGLIANLTAARHVASRIPVSPEERNRLLSEIMLERCIPHDGQPVGHPRMAIIEGHVGFLHAIAQAHQEVDMLSTERLQSILDRLLAQTEPSNVRDDFFFTIALVPALRILAPILGQWSSEQILTMLHLVRHAQLPGPYANRVLHALPDAISRGDSFEEIFARVRDAPQIETRQVVPRLSGPRYGMRQLAGPDSRV